METFGTNNWIRNNEKDIKEVRKIKIYLRHVGRIIAAMRGGYIDCFRAIYSKIYNHTMEAMRVRENHDE